jgi:large repetitive protein
MGMLVAAAPAAAADDTSTAVVSSANPSAFGQTVTFTATVSTSATPPPAPTGTVTFLADGNLIATTTLSGGTASASTSSLGVGSHVITATYNGDLNFNGSTTTLAGNQVVNKADTGTAVFSSPNPSNLGGGVTLTASVSSSGGTPPGTVTFLSDGNPLSTATLNGGGIASITTGAGGVPNLPGGSHVITAAYNGNASFKTSTGTMVGNQIVNRANSSTNLIPSLNPSVIGQSVTFTAILGGAVSGIPQTGTVTFMDDGTPIGSSAVSGGTAAITRTNLSVGNHPITATYSGDDSYMTSTSSVVSQVVSKATSTTALAGDHNPSVFGQAVTFTASVGAAGFAPDDPSGTVTFMDGAAPIGTAPISGGVATLTTGTLPVGSRTISANYNGDSNFKTSTANLTGNPQVISKAQTTTLVASDRNTSPVGQPVTFTALVAGVGPDAVAPTGTVTFLDGGTPIAFAPLSGGLASFTTSALAAGSHSITASYAGTSNVNGSQSQAFGFTVNAGEAAPPPVVGFTYAQQGRNLVLNVSGPGTAAVTSGSTTPSSATGGPGTIALPLNLTSKANKALKKKGKLTFVATITFTPNGGQPTTQSAVVNLKGKK